MPIYEYYCTQCGLVLEKLIIGSEPVPLEQACPACKRNCSRILSAGSFKLNGSDWDKSGFNGKRGG